MKLSIKHRNYYFRCMRGTSSNHFESHLCMLIFRNHIKSAGENLFVRWFQEVTKLYTLDKAPTLNACTGMFGMSFEKTTNMLTEDETSKYKIVNK